MGTPYPCPDMKVTLRTAFAGQTEFVIRVVQGDSNYANDCTEIQSLKISQIPPAPAGQQSFTCTFKLDRLGNLSVSAESDCEHAMITETSITKNGEQMEQEEIEEAIEQQKKEAE